MNMYVMTGVRTIIVVGALVACSPASAQNVKDVVAVPPTRLASTALRGGAGKFGAPREGGAKHSGVDIIANQSSTNRTVYEVHATSDGVVAYARMNGTETTGYGYTVIVDHRNGFYTMYAHLATVASSSVVEKGDAVSKGQVIGYLADLEKGEYSSGNVQSDVVKDYEKIQLHFEVFTAPSGRSSEGQIAPVKAGSTLVDPTTRLQELGYKPY